MDFITAFLTAAGQVVTSFGSILTNAVSAVTSVFYNGEEITIVGAGLALAMGVGAVYLLFRLIRGLVKQNERG